jgi:hypothetical protein
MRDILIHGHAATRLNQRAAYHRHCFPPCDECAMQPLLYRKNPWFR